jgi:hypothetical protein
LTTSEQSLHPSSNMCSITPCPNAAFQDDVWSDSTCSFHQCPVCRRWWSGWAPIVLFFFHSLFSLFYPCKNLKTVIYFLYLIWSHSFYYCFNFIPPHLISKWFYIKFSSYFLIIILFFWSSFIAFFLKFYPLIFY